ncbi:MAG: TetR/AcrR family transcriptional regulator [Thermoanaerobacterales bacterium]|nr:TetR/AcrR family transcriptional regulator [Thermoanaerobacterales bacterium]
MELQDLSVLNRAERKKEKTRTKIIDVAIGLFDKQGFDSTTMEQIAEQADVARKTLYNHFPVKEAIISEYVDRFIRERESELHCLIQENPDTYSRLMAVFNRSMEWARIKGYVYLVYITFRMQDVLRDGEKNIRRSRITAILQEILIRGQEAGEIRRDIPLQMMVIQLDTIRLTMIMGWLKDPEEFSVQTFIAKSIDLFLNGCMNRSGRDPKGGDTSG